MFWDVWWNTICRGNCYPKLSSKPFNLFKYLDQILFICRSEYSSWFFLRFFHLLSNTLTKKILTFPRDISFNVILPTTKRPTFGLIKETHIVTIKSLYSRNKLFTVNTKSTRFAADFLSPIKVHNRNKNRCSQTTPKTASDWAIKDFSSSFANLNLDRIKIKSFSRWINLRQWKGSLR